MNNLIISFKAVIIRKGMLSSHGSGGRLYPDKARNFPKALITNALQTCSQSPNRDSENPCFSNNLEFIHLLTDISAQEFHGVDVDMPRIYSDPSLRNRIRQHG